MKKKVGRLSALIGVVVCCAVAFIACSPKEHTHSVSSEWSKDAAYHWHTCSGCEDLLDKAEHTWDAGKVTTEPTYDAAGVKTFTCTVCAYAKTEAIPALQHHFSGEWSKDETIHWHACTDAECEEKSDVAAHTFDAGVVTTQPTYDAAGVKTFTCTVCGQTKTESIAKKEHNISSVWTTDETNHWHACGECDDKFDVTAHTWGDWTRNPETDQDYRVCSVCEYRSAEVAHDYNANHVCANCGKVDPAVVAKVGDLNFVTLQAALDAVDTENATVVLVKNVVVDAQIVITKSVTIEGDFTIQASDAFVGNQFFYIDTAVNVEFKDVTVDASGKARAIVIKKGALKINGATVTGGHSAASYIGGVYVTNAASFEMTGGSITGNTSGAYADDDYLQYANDLWIGANANGSLASITGGTVGNLFVNANEYSANNPGGFVLSGGAIDNLYVEYDKGFGGSFTYESGTIGKLMVSTKTNGTYGVIAHPEAGVYVGGLVAKVGENGYATLEEALAAADAQTVTLYADVELASTLTIDKSVIIDGQGQFTVKAADAFPMSENAGKPVTVVAIDTANITVEFRNVTLNANQKGRAIVIKKGLLKINGATVTGGKAQDSYIGGVYVTNAAKFEMTGGRIEGNTSNRTDYLQYADDLWIGANADGAMTMTGGKVGSAFVNANEYSQNNPGCFTLGGGEIGNLYVEYDKGFGGSFVYKSGTIDNLMVSTKTNGVYAITETPAESEAGIVVKGGTVEAVANIDGQNYASLAAAIEATNAEGGDTVTLNGDVAGVDKDGKYLGDLRVTAKTRDYNFTLDLGGHTLGQMVFFNNFYKDETGKSVFSEFGITVVVKNGAIGNTVADSYYGLAINGNEKLDVTISDVNLVGYYSGLYTNGSCAGAKVSATNVTAVSHSSDAGAYLAANYTYNFKNCSFTGGTGLYLKSGTYVLDGCTIAATADYTAPSYNGNGAEPTGDGIAVDSAQGYKPTLNVTVKDCTVTSANGYGVHEFVTHKEGATQTKYSVVTYEGVNEITAKLGDKQDDASVEE